MPTSADLARSMPATLLAIALCGCAANQRTVVPSTDDAGALTAAHFVRDTDRVYVMQVGSVDGNHERQRITWTDLGDGRYEQAFSSEGLDFANVCEVDSDGVRFVDSRNRTDGQDTVVAERIRGQGYSIRFVTPGETWVDDSTMQLADGSKVSGHDEVHFVGYEPIEVLDQTWSAARLEAVTISVLRSPGPDATELSSQGSSTFWLVQGLGTVRVENRSLDLDDGSEWGHWMQLVAVEEKTP
jgi:hypothetical protein